MAGEDDPGERMTRDLSRSKVVGWSFAVAVLERTAPWAVTALRLGMLSLLQEATRAMAQPNANIAWLGRAAEIVAALKEIPVRDRQ